MRLKNVTYYYSMSMHTLRAKLSAHVGKTISERAVLDLISEHTDITASNTVVIHDANAIKNINPAGITVIYIDVSLITLCALDNLMKRFTDAKHVILRSSSVIGSGQLFISTVSDFDLELFVVLVTRYEPSSGFLLEWDRMITSHNKLYVFHHDVKFQKNQTKGLINLIALSDQQENVTSESDSDSDSEADSELYIPDAAVAFSNLEDDVPLITLDSGDIPSPPNYPPPPPPPPPFPPSHGVDIDSSDDDSDLSVDPPDLPDQPDQVEIIAISTVMNAVEQAMQESGITIMDEID